MRDLSMPNDESAGTAEDANATPGSQELSDACLDKVAGGAGIPATRPLTLQATMPLKYTGPTLAGKGGGDVAMETLTLTHEGLEP
jgi:hypothetical protein